ncbi:hypothetical protein BD289DRAFT_296355 [Coniella lustricola]|uniref:Transmembrane protein n=1 Tax=Coniella lustricola TaxID=2025994 RepID=A0A2T3A4Z6_9PEZI|nr:hypothetical protein BD289DRAFT_296355 [Coniella lustricola]
MEASHPSNPPATLRRSRFMENMFDDLPLDEPVRQAKREFNANDDDVERQQPQQQQPHKPLRKRGLNIDWRRWRGNSALARSLLTAGLHLAVTSMLVAILIEFLERERDSEDFVSRRRAISLLIVAGLDCAVDVHALFHCMQRDHRGWVVFLRLALSCGYMVHFLLLAQLGRLFPPEYSYWDCDAKSSDMLMYILVSIVLAWDICHAAHHRDAIFDAITSLLSRFCRNISTEKETDRGTVTKSFVPHVNRPRPAARRSHAQTLWRAHNAHN